MHSYSGVQLHVGNEVGGSCYIIHSAKTLYTQIDSADILHCAFINTAQHHEFFGVNQSEYIGYIWHASNYYRPSKRMLRLYHRNTD